MRYLFSDWKKVEKALRGKFIYLFLDYDGTLSPIARTPGKAIMPKKTKDVLRRLSKMPNCKIAIVSGRSVHDVQRRIGLKNIVYVGNHGFEVKGPKIKFKSPGLLRHRRILSKIKDKMSIDFAPIRGVLIEDKGFSLSVHYRLADKKDISFIKEACYSTALPYEIKHDVKVGVGKMVLEVTPDMAWNKGKVVLWLLGRQEFAMRRKKIKMVPIYIGDDITDEDAFAALKNIGITILAGRPGKSKAVFYLKDTNGVLKFLKSLL